MKYEGETACIMSIVGEGVGRAFAREGAHVLLAGRTREKLEAVARDIEGEGGSGAVAVLDALDDKALMSMPTRWSHPGDISVLTNGGKCKNTHHGSYHQGGIRLTDKENEQ
jgi:NADP-dependent 3-hydroxy acid dehydrogenase YdfG